MPRRNYKMRINVRPLNENKLYAYVALSDECVELFEKPYVSVKRMQDRLAFVPWETKTGNGMVLLNNNTLQFGVQEDCEKMQDFCGEYNLVNKTDSGVVFVKLADRKPFTREHEGNRSQHDKCSEIIVDCSELVVNGDKPAVPSLKELLGKKIEELQDEESEIKAEIDRVTAPLEARLYDIGRQLVAYCNAYDYMKDGE